MDNTAYKLNLQLFAEPEETAAESAASGADGQAAETGAGEKTFTQADVDRIVNQRLAREKRENERMIEQVRQEARSEAEKLAKMTGEQKQQHEREKAERAAREREANLATREAEITRRELRAEAIDTLVNRGLPVGLADILHYGNADECSASIDKVEQIFRAAVQSGVEERLNKSAAPLKRGADAEAALLAQMRKAAGLND